jgi:hypothetical protein
MAGVTKAETSSTSIVGKPKDLHIHTITINQHFNSDIKLAGL